MTKHINPFKILALAALIALPAMSRAGQKADGSEKIKTISKSYNVSATEKLRIENSFGDVQINTWDKNEFKVDVEMYAKGNSEERAQYILDHIKVTESQSDNTVRFKTDIHINGGNHDGDDNDNDGDDDKDNNNNRNRNRHNNNNQQFHVNYVVYMPATNPLSLENSFGKTTVPDFKGSANLTSKFGSLTAGNLSNVESIAVEFGKAEIGDVHNGKLTFKFDDRTEIGKLSGSIKLNIEFSGHVQFNVSNNIEELTLNESYSSIRMIVQKELSADFSIHTSFGSFHNGTEFNISATKDDDDNGPHFDKDYTGTLGGGKAKIKVKSSFGDVKLSYTGLTKDEEEKERAEKKEKKEKRERKEKKETKESEESK